MEFGMMIAERQGEFTAGQRTTLNQFFPDLVPNLSSAASVVAEAVASIYAAVVQLLLACGKVVPWWAGLALIVAIAMSITVSRARTLK